MDKLIPWHRLETIIAVMGVDRTRYPPCSGYTAFNNGTASVIRPWKMPFMKLRPCIICRRIKQDRTTIMNLISQSGSGYFQRKPMLTESGIERRLSGRCHDRSSDIHKESVHQTRKGNQWYFGMKAHIAPYLTQSGDNSRQ